MKLKTRSTVQMGSRVADSIRYAANPLPQLTPTNLAAYLDAFSRGYLRDTAILWHLMAWRDDRIQADSSKRCKTLARYGYRVVAADGVDPDSPDCARHIAAIKYALENMGARDVLDASVRGGLSMVVRQMMRAVGNMYQVHELVWKTQPGGVTLDAIAYPLWWFERTTGALRYLAQDLALEGVPLEPAGWMVSRGDGLMAATSTLYLLKRMALGDWAVYNGRVGPGIHGTTSAQPGSTDWNTLEEAVSNFGFDLTMVTGDGVKISPIEMALTGTLPWPAMYEAMTKAISVLWRGGNLLTDSGGVPDQSGVTLQGEEADVLEQDDAEMIGDALNDSIVEPLIRHRFGEDPLAWVEWNAGARQDVASERDTDRFLSEMGWQFSSEDLGERYGRTPPPDGATLLTPRAAAAAPAPALPFGVPMRAANSQGEQVQQRLVASATAALAEAERQDLQPLVARLQAALAIEDPGLLYAALEQLRAELPALARQLLADPSAAGVLENSISAALLNGYAEGAEHRVATHLGAANYDPDQPRDDRGRWTDTVSGGMRWVSSSGSSFVTLNDQVTMRSPRGSTSAKLTRAVDPDDAMRAALVQAGKDPAEFKQLEGSRIVFHRDDEDRWAEAFRRAENNRTRTASASELRRALVERERATYSDQNAPGSASWRANQDAKRELAAFDRSHPDVAVQVKQRAEDREKARGAFWDTPEGREKQASL